MKTSQKTNVVKIMYLSFTITALIALLLPSIMTSDVRSDNSLENTMTLNKLTAEEKKVIIDKGTERAFTGEYYNSKENGTYTCKQCDASLYKSNDKFDARCGWPSFDDEVPGAVKRTLDTDGHRTEITCAKCDAHLGHVFEGEGFTDKNTRHCVNSISLNFISASNSTERAYFAGGCFWGTEYFLQKQQGVISTEVGYMGGTTRNPTYKDVCYKKTGHAEAVEVIFNPSEVTFEALARLFFEIHDPSQLNRQGPDIGDQYRSAIFFTDENQEKIAKKLINQLKDHGHKVVTQLEKAELFWNAELNHQDYYDKNGHKPYCHVYTKRF